MTTSRTPRKTATSTAARQAKEILEGGVPVKFKGQTFVVPKGQDWTIDAIEAFENGLVARALRELLGEDWDRFRVVAKTGGDLNAFYDAATQAIASLPE